MCAEDIKANALVCRFCGYDYRTKAIGGAPRAEKINGLAIASMVLGIVWIYWLGSILAVVFGHISLSQIKKSDGDQSGRGMAIAGLVLGYLGIASLAALIAVLVVGANFDSSFGVDPKDHDVSTKSLATPTPGSEIPIELYFDPQGAYRMGIPLAWVASSDVDPGTEAWIVDTPTDGVTPVVSVVTAEVQANTSYEAFLTTSIETARQNVASFKLVDSYFGPTSEGTPYAVYEYAGSIDGRPVASYALIRMQPGEAVTVKLNTSAAAYTRVLDATRRFIWADPLPHN
ncbi:MAG: DUF4190 domain-containing protein [Proteobacteria bacterium]|nr:DUF4190 domain-containing protein [Pseudomonadota bacterium]